MTDAPNPDELYGRVMMIMGVDANGDTHVFGTTDLKRAVARYREMLATMTEVRGNDGFNELARPVLDQMN